MDDSKYEYWLDIAEYDLETAEAMLTTKRYLYVGFMCHQVVEKLLKGYFAKIHNERPPYIHNLAKLIDSNNLSDKISEEQKIFISFLQPLNIQSRYPAYKEKVLKNLDYNRCSKLIIETREFSGWIKNMLFN